MKSVQIRNFFWTAFSRIRTEYEEIQENMDQKKIRIWTLFTQRIFIPCFSWSMFFRVHVFQSTGFSGSRFSRVQDFLHPGFLRPGFPGSRVRVQGLGPGFRSSRNNESECYIEEITKIKKRNICIPEKGDDTHDTIQVVDW